MTLSQETPREQLPGAFAYALPYEGSHIVVFYDRVSSEIAEPRRLPALLAHVMVHEIAHILEGIDNHSETGIMKLHWDERDYEQMTSNPLKFTDRDISLIHAGMAYRQSLRASQPGTAAH